MSRSLTLTHSIPVDGDGPFLAILRDRRTQACRVVVYDTFFSSKNYSVRQIQNTVLIVLKQSSFEHKIIEKSFLVEAMPRI